jgi:CxxC motif-containing protein
VSKEIVCIICPNGCRIRVAGTAGSLKIDGHACQKGFEYAVKEATNPERIITSSVKVIGGEMPLASVKTKEPILKAKIKKVMQEIKKARVKAPVEIGDVVIQNVGNTGVDVVATRKVY